MYGQITGNSPQRTNFSDNLAVQGFSYPVSPWGEEHSSFLITMDFSNRFKAELEGFYDTYIWSNRFRTALLGKYFLSQRFYLFSGIEVEIETEAKDTRREVLPPRVGFLSGVGHEVKENFFIEARGNFQLNNSKLGSFGESQIPTPKVYTLGGRLKF